MPHFTQSLKKELSFYGFEPVNLVTGSVLYEGIDFFFPGMLPKKDASDLIHHSDRGTQYTSRQYTNMLNKRGIQISMTESGAPKENSQSERINSTIKNEFLKGKVFRSIARNRECRLCSLSRCRTPVLRGTCQATDTQRRIT